MKFSQREIDYVIYHPDVIRVEDIPVDTQSYHIVPTQGGWKATDNVFGFSVVDEKPSNAVSELLDKIDHHLLAMQMAKGPEWYRFAMDFELFIPKELRKRIDFEAISTNLTFQRFCLSNPNLDDYKPRHAQALSEAKLMWHEDGPHYGKESDDSYSTWTFQLAWDDWRVNKETYLIKAYDKLDFRGNLRDIFSFFALDYPQLFSEAQDNYRKEAESTKISQLLVNV